MKKEWTLTPARKEDLHEEKGKRQNKPMQKEEDHRMSCMAEREKEKRKLLQGGRMGGYAFWLFMMGFFGWLLGLVCINNYRYPSAQRLTTLYN